MKKILVFIIFFFFVLSSFASFVLATNLDDLKNQKDELSNQITEKNNELKYVQGQVSENMAQLIELNAKVLEYEGEIYKLNDEVEELENQIEETTKRLNESQEKYDKREELLRQRIIAMYEAGETTYLDVLLNSKSLTDFISNYYIITEIAEYDTKLLETIEEEKKNIEIEKEKLEYNQVNLKEAKANKEKTYTVLQNTRILKNNYIEQLSEEEKQLQVDVEEYTKAFAEVEKQISELTLSTGAYVGGEMAWPTPGYTRITSEFGMREHPITGVYKLHTGLDIGAPSGANFVAANDGTVISAKYSSGYGNMVIIDHGGGITTLYAHGSSIEVSVGQKVKRGDVVLKVGSTGYSTGPHAHFEVRENGSYVNPLPYITSN